MVTPQILIRLLHSDVWEIIASILICVVVIFISYFGILLDVGRDLYKSMFLPFVLVTFVSFPFPFPFVSSSFVPFVTAAFYGEYHT